MLEVEELRKPQPEGVALVGMILPRENFKELDWFPRGWTKPRIEELIAPRRSRENRPRDYDGRCEQETRSSNANRLSKMLIHGMWKDTPNVPDHRYRASDVRHGTKALSRHSVHPLVRRSPINAS